MNKAKKIAWGLFRALVVLMVVFYAAAGALTLWFGRQVESKTRAIAARGEPISVADIAGGARGPGAAAFEAAMKQFTAVKVSDAEEEALATVASYTSEKPAPEDWAAARGAIEKLGPALDELSKAATTGEVSLGFGILSENSSSLETFRHIRRAVRTLSARALIRARDGDPSGAADDLVAALRVSRTASPRGAVIGALVRIACVNISCAGVRGCLQIGEFPDEQTRRLCSALDAAGLDELLPRAMLYERAVSHMSYQTMMRGDMDNQGKPLPAARRGLLWKLEMLPVRAMLYANESVSLDALALQSEQMRKPYREFRKSGKDGDIAGQLPWWAVLAKMTVPVFARAHAANDRCEATVEAVKTMLALERCRAANGSYPDTLADAQGFGCRFGDDPFSGKPFVYRRQGDGFLLYSIGDDLKDNGGKQAGKNTGQSGGTDVVWTMPK